MKPYQPFELLKQAHEALRNDGWTMDQFDATWRREYTTGAFDVIHFISPDGDAETEVYVAGKIDPLNLRPGNKLDYLIPRDLTEAQIRALLVLQ